MTNTIRPLCRSGRLPSLALALGTVGLLAAGCGGKTNRATVSGKVTYHGQPLPGGSLVLHPANGGPDYPITLNSNGEFQVSGAPLGDMKVTIDNSSLRNIPPPGTSPYGAVKPPPGQKLEMPQVSTEGMGHYVKVPAKYQGVKTTPLTWTIQKGSEKKEFDLTD